MGDRVRNGELLAAIGTVALVVALAFMGWFNADVAGTAIHAGAQISYRGRLNLDAGTIGWFAFLVLIVALVASIVFLLRAITARSAERPMLQAPFAYVSAGFAFLTLLVRLFIFTPGASEDAVMSKLPPGARILQSTADLGLARGAWVALGGVALMMLGAWFAMYDERTGSAAAKRRTAELLADVEVRRVPHVPAPAEPDSEVVADDAVGTDPSTPSSPASGGPA